MSNALQLGALLAIHRLAVKIL